MSKKKKAPTPTKMQEARGEQMSFFPPPEFSPIWPTRGTLADKLIGFFMTGQRLDHPAFERLTRSWRLSAVVFKLKELGWPVDSIDIYSPTPERPDRSISLYYLDGKYIAQASAIQSGKK